MPSFGSRKRRLPEGGEKVTVKEKLRNYEKVEAEKSKEERGKKKEPRLTTRLFH
jgi:hypothetical protein